MGRNRVLNVSVEKKEETLGSSTMGGKNKSKKAMGSGDGGGVGSGRSKPPFVVIMSHGCQHACWRQTVSHLKKKER